MHAVPLHKRLVCLLASVIFALLLSACGGDDDGSAPAVGAQTGNQTASPRGDSQTSPPASAGGTLGAATLSWTAPLQNTDGSVLLNLSGFKIYYGRAPGTLDSTISVTNPSVSTYVVESLSTGTWYFGVAAINSQGVESPLSNVASKTIG